MWRPGKLEKLITAESVSAAVMENEIGEKYDQLGKNKLEKDLPEKE